MEEDDVRAEDRELVPRVCGQTTCLRRSKYHGLDEFETWPPRAKREENRQLKRVVADNYLSIPNLKASAERELGNPILHTPFPTILGTIGQEMLEIGGDCVSS